MKKLYILKVGTSSPLTAVTFGDVDAQTLDALGTVDVDTGVLDVEHGEPLPAVSECAGVIITGSSGISPVLWNGIRPRKTGETVTYSNSRLTPPCNVNILVSTGTEIDFVVKLGEQTVPVECKDALSISRRHLKGIRSYLDLYDLPVGVVLSFAPHEVFQRSPARRVVNLPAYMVEELALEAEPLLGVGRG